MPKKPWLLLLAVILLALPNARAQQPDTQYTILVSLDGFRWDYTQRGITPNLQRISRDGVAAISLKPPFPSKTFPSHITLVTGLYPQNHGIILNDFYDPWQDYWYTLGDRESLTKNRYYRGEMIWETAQRQGVLCASYFWPGSEMDIAWRRPHYYQPYDHQRAFPERIDGLLAWLDLPEAQRPRFLTLYFHPVDDAGHKFGPESAEVNRAIALTDSLLGLLISGLQNRGLLNRTNLIVVSDHGMMSVSNDKLINVQQKWLAGINCRYLGMGPFLFIQPEPEQAERVYRILKNGQEHFTTWWKKDLPEDLHFSDNAFIPDIILLAEPEWSLVSNGHQTWLPKKGNHGYSNHLLEMHGLFRAMGPKFRQGLQTGTLEAVDLYPLLCELLEIIPAQNIDGNIQRIGYILER